jgi:hypothetical protein
MLQWHAPPPTGRKSHTHQQTPYVVWLPLVQVPPGVPVSILWGADDPWEDMKEGRRLFAHYPCVTGTLEGVGWGVKG